MRRMSDGQDTELQGDGLLEMAWVVIANASDWTDETRSEWREAAERWRDAYHKTLPQVKAGAVPVS